MDINESIKTTILGYLKDIGISDFEVVFDTPKDKAFGDLTTNIALKVAKQAEKSPLEVAKDISALFGGNNQIEKVEVAAPGFLNFYLNKSLTKEVVNMIILEPDFGTSKWGSGQTWLIEHTSPNPNKAMHLGHLRNNVTGMAVSNLSKAIGVNIVMDCIDNNRGIAIAKLMWGFLKFANKDQSKQVEDLNEWYNNQDEWQTPQDLNLSSDKFMDQLYVKGAEDFKNPQVEEKIRKLVVDWENEDEKTWELWKKVLDYVYAGQAATLKRLGSHWDYIWHEHEHYQEGKEIVEEGLKKGIFIKTDNGAVVTNLKKYNLPDTIVIKKDGTSLYITQDLALTKRKIEKFHPDKLFWVIGPEQSLAMKQVFAVSDQLGFGKFEDFNHIAYGFISIKGQGKMSSRAGNVVYIDDLLDDARDTVLEKIKNENLTDADKFEVAEKVGLGAVKYSILKVGRLTDTAFDFNTSLSFEGDSGPYLMYTYARCASILRQSKTNVDKVENLDIVFNTEEEAQVVRILNQFSKTVFDAAINYSPNLICSYLFELAQIYNKFYNQHSVLNAQKSEDIRARVALTFAVSQVLKKGLNLLGIETVEAM